MARPRSSETERRSECFAIRLTPGERIALIAEAERLAISPTSLARQRLLRGRVVVQEHRRLDPRQVFELGRIGVNLNQIARALNSGQSINPATIEAALAELRQLLAGILSARAEAGPGVRGGADAEAAPPLPEIGDGGDAPAGEADPAPTRPAAAPHQKPTPPAARR